MKTTLVIRPVTPNDLQVIGDFITDLGYTARREALLAMLGPMLEDRRNMRGFLLARGFGQADSATYRWGLLEGGYQAPPTIHHETRPASWSSPIDASKLPNIYPAVILL